MVYKQPRHTINTTISQLGRFNLSFEYDKTLQQVKKETVIRTI